MYAETGLMFPCFQSFSPDVQQFDDLCYSNKSNSCLGNEVQSSIISDYDFGGEGDLFKAPEPIIEQPLATLDAMSMINCGEDDLSSQELSAKDIESFQNDVSLSEIFHEFKEILAKEATETSPLSEVLNYNIPVKTDEIPIVKENVHPPGQIPKSVSSECLSSSEWTNGAQLKPGFFNITELDFGNVYGMRRAFSEGDIKTLDNGNGSHRQPHLMSEHTTEDRWQKLSRYRNKKTKRNFGRKIKYACRKALADSQPRIRGRFAKTEESEILRKF
ncbi:hypothetical protein L2E82_07270 [Cichorium intybus]|uniref:Uncharacterized protein n=1 Tax=Cichorium intybus TaxID=13427 RepID=A0ACB9G4R7_CICIN|nr:hypothetical protein L2E82_07270 [Cichorium intybus]